MDPQLVRMFDGLHGAIRQLSNDNAGMHEQNRERHDFTDKMISDTNEATNKRISDTNKKIIETNEKTNNRITELQQATEMRINELQKQIVSPRVVLQPDPSMRHTGFNIWCEQEFKQRYPKKFTSDMCTGLFTYSCVYSEPIYVEDWTITQFDRAKAMLTDYILPQFSKNKIEQIIQSDYARILPLDKPNYIPTTNTDHAKEAKPSSTVSVIKSFGAQWAEKVPIGTNMPYNHNSVNLPIILNLYPDPIESIKQIGDRVYFNGLITVSTYTIAELINTPQQLWAIMQHCLLQRVKLNVADCYYQVKINYMSDNAKEVPIILYKGSDPSDFLYDQPLFESLKEQLSEMYEYDPDVFNSYYLDYTKFYIETIRLTRSGSAPSKNYYTENLGWATVFDFKSAGNGCFVKILREAVLAMKKAKITNMDAGVSYKALWRILDKMLETETFGMPTDITWAKKACYKLDLNLIIYDMSGNIIDKEHVNNSLTKLIRVVYKVGDGTGHFAYVSNYHPDRQVDTDVPKPEGPLHMKKEKQIVHIYYDLETVNTVELLAESNVLPYSISWQIENKSVKSCCISNDINHSQLLQRMLDDVRNDFSSRKLTMDVHYVFIAYNGARFDHNFLFMHLCSNNWHMTRTPNHKKVIDLTFFMGQKNGNKAIGKVWDPYLFTLLPLRDTCKAFGLETSKGYISHEEVQKAYEEEKLLDLLSQKGDAITEYNKKDVEVLRELVSKIVVEVKKAIGITLTNYQTIGSACYALFSEDLKKHNCKPAKSWDIDQLIRKAIIGGRVTRMHDAVRFAKGGAMVDLVSQYPHVMETCWFPSGEEERYDDEQRAIKDYSEGKLGIWKCSVTMKVNKYGHSVLPIKSEAGNKWNWDKNVEGEYVLDSQTITDVLNSGGRVLMHGLGVVWPEKTRVFDNYIKKFKKMKEDEDEKKRKGKPYNPVLRQMGKMFLNCLSGKVGQKNFLEETIYWSLSDQDRLINYLEKHKLDNVQVYPVCFAGIFTVKKLNYEEAYKRPYPSQLAVYIYSYAKSLMWNMLYSKMTVYYSDTDSGVISTKDLMKCKNLYDPANKKEFGMLEVDHKEFKYLFSPMSKAYCLFSVNEDAVVVHKYRFKGVRKQDQYLYQDKWITFSEEPFTLYKMLHDKMEVRVRTFAFRSKVLEGKYTHSFVEKLFI